MLFRLADVHKSYGTQEVLRGVTFQINPGEHVGLVGRNGAGKTTILRMIAGGESPDQGDFERQRGLRVGVLAQHVDFGGESTVLEAALAVFERLLGFERTMRDLECAMTEATGDQLDRVMNDYSEAQHAYEHEGGFTYHARAESVLLGLGFTKDEFGKRAASLSGGEKNRLGLVRLLLQEPDILLLDEPTNHLDVEAVEWLEGFLTAYRSAYLIISHDRFFLDHTVNRVLDLEFGKVDSYKGNYSAYQVEKAERLEHQQRAYELQQEMIARTEDFIRRNLAGQKTKQAKSRRIMLQKIDRLESVSAQDSANFKLHPTSRTGDQVLILDRLSIGFPTRTLASHLSLTLRRGDRLGVIGGNGTGKTTFLRTILGEQAPLDGDLRWGTGVKTGYYDQRLTLVDDRHTVLEELRSVAPATVPDGELRGFLGRFLFTGDDVFKSVAALSGGEKGRLALARLIYSRVNVLILDEPTNHLDIASCEALEDALNEYGGTIITVSHDRYFLDRIATRILSFGPAGVEDFDGGYSEFYEAHHRAPAPAVVVRVEDPKARPRRPVETSSRDLGGGRKKRVTGPSAGELEAEIQGAEAGLAELTTQLSSEEVVRDRQRMVAITSEYQTLEAQLRQLYQEWEAALEREAGGGAAASNSASSR
jgi:ATP-binding cassette subfamily F protein 3